MNVYYSSYSLCMIYAFTTFFICINVWDCSGVICGQSCIQRHKHVLLLVVMSKIIVYYLLFDSSAKPLHQAVVN